MGFLNTTEKKTTASHSNFMGGRSFDINDPVARLRMVAASCFFGEPMYYTGQTAKPVKSEPMPRANGMTDEDYGHMAEYLTAQSPASWRSLSPASAMEQTIDEALNHDPENTLRVAAELRNDDHIRITPQVILVRAAMSQSLRGTGLITKWAPEIIKRADEPAVCLAYFLSAYGEKTPIPTCLKKALGKALRSYSEYQLAKYRMESRQVKTVDVVNLVRPVPTEAINKLIKGQLKLGGDNKTWESIRSSGGTWGEAIGVGVMGHMALLRNLRNLSSSDAPMDAYLKKLVDTAATGKQLPFRYYSAFKHLGSSPNPKIQDAIEEAMLASLGTLPRFPGRVMSLCDNSGSAQGTFSSKQGSMRVSEIANLSGVLTAKVADEGHVGIFGDKLETFPVRQRSSIFDDMKTAETFAHGIGQGTEHGIWLFFDRALRNKEHWDHIFVYSDMQAGHGGLYGTSGYEKYAWPNKHGGQKMIDVPKLINEYRRVVNPNVYVYLVQVAGYKDTILPEFYDKTFILGGWSDGILKFAAAMAGLSQGQAPADDEEEGQ